MNYYELFDLPVSYTLDRNRLTEVYLKKQQIVHPDVLSVADIDADGQKIVSCVDHSRASAVVTNTTGSNESSSVDLNIAYGILMDPVKRAEYFLSLHGIQVDNISVHYAAEMFDISDRYNDLKTSAEKLDFQQGLMQHMREIEKNLEALEQDLAEFHKMAVLLRFMESFLGKVRLDAYNRN
jgi:molecular chaperone HscB